MLTRTSEYALRALIHLAQHENDWPIPGNQISERAGIPGKYLSKVLGDLVRVGLLESARGKSGGFRLVRPAKEISLLEVLAPFEQFEQKRCPFADSQCGDEDPCLAHAQWKIVLDTQRRFFQNTSLLDVAVKRKDISRGNGRKREQ